MFKEYADLADNIEEAPQTQSQMQALENLLAACSSDNHQKAIHYFDTNGDNEFTKDDIDNIKKDINGDGIIDDKDKNILDEQPLIELPDLDTIVTVQDDSDDVWKF